MSDLTLLVPAPFNTVSGGYSYDRHIVDGLRAIGRTVDVVALPGTYPLVGDSARNAVCTAWDSLAPATRPIIDGLALPAFTGMEDALVAHNAVGLIHHPTSLETGSSETDRDTLFALEKRLLPRLAHIIVTSETTAARLIADYSVAAERLRVIVPGTEPAERSLGSGGPTCRILSVGTLVPRKGHDLLLRALARLFDLDWHLTIVGTAERDPVHARSLIAEAESLGITQRVQFTGEITDAELEALWRQADIFALATHWEGYGMAVAEALKRGVPVAVTAGGAAATLMTPDAGVVCPAGDRINLSKALRRLIFNPKLRQAMADAAWQIGQTLPDWQTQARAFAQALA